MRVIVISAGVLAIAAVFGLGVVVGRFVLKDDAATVSAPSNAILGPPGMDNPLGDPNAAISTDPSINALPPAPAAPLPPATAPNSSAGAPVVPPTITARAESDAAIAASSVSVGCNVVVNKDAPIRSWAQKDRVAAIASGDTCGTATIRLSLQTPEGAALYTLQAPARDFGIAPTASADEVRERIGQILPIDTIRAAAYPQWKSDGPAPSGTEFNREAYEAVRSANAPITCLKMPNVSVRCVATDPGSGQIKVFSRG
jgi:hypothetical protein